MKRTIMVISLLLLLICGLTACKQEAGVCRHAWKEATCTEPKTCKVCASTEGDALGHSVMEATYQMGEHCVNCGELFGELILAEFVRTGKSYQTVDLTSAQGKIYYYVTGRDNFTKSATCEVRVKWAVPMEPELGTHSTAIRCYVPEGVFPEVVQVTGIHDIMENLDGYTWRGIEADIKFGATGTGNLIWGYEDFYELTQYDKDAVQTQRDTGAVCTTSGFSVNMNGEIYDQCRMVSFAVADDSGVALYVFYRVPDGYDGCVFSCIDSRIFANSSEEAGSGFTSYANIGHGVGDIYFRLK